MAFFIQRRKDVLYRAPETTAADQMARQGLCDDLVCVQVHALSQKGLTMKQVGIRLLSVVLGVVVALFVLVFPASAQTQSFTNAPYLGVKVVGTAMTPCQSLVVQLHGIQPATTTCLDGRTGPDIGVDNPCHFGADLEIWWNANEGDPEICFRGAGSTNMTNYCAQFGSNCVNWNDQASSYYTGCSPATFYVNIDDGGSNVTEPAYHAGNFTPGAVPNDSLSSVKLSSNC